MNSTTVTPKNTAPVSPAECVHLSGYWINRAARTFRCYGCGCQFHLRDIPMREGRQIEAWKPRP